MYYNFVNILNNDEDIFDEFMDKYVTYLDSYENEDSIAILREQYKEIYALLNNNFELDDILSKFQTLAEYKILHDIPYVIFFSEIHGLKNIFIAKIFDSDNHDNDIKKLLLLFKEINEKVAYVYLKAYIKNLISTNKIRLNSIHDMLETDIIQYYEAHLLWLNNLAGHIKVQKKENFVELDDTLCTFGKWLHSDAKMIIKNNSKYKTISNLHANLHLFANKIYKNLEHNEYHIFLSYLEKCEFISLSLGTELALIDNAQMNQKIKKDNLTGALNRNSLKDVFEHQYELALATSNSFVFAMCDLDFFKNINDTYGHVAGDKVLAHFVTTAKKHIRNADIIIRYGGEEFIIILSTVKEEKGLSVLNALREAFEKTPLLYDTQSIEATLSIGMMEVHPKESYKKEYLERYLKIVDQKLYMAKDLGRNRVET